MPVHIGEKAGPLVFEIYIYIFEENPNLLSFEERALSPPRGNTRHL